MIRFFMKVTDAIYYNLLVVYCSNNVFNSNSEAFRNLENLQKKISNIPKLSDISMKMQEEEANSERYESHIPLYYDENEEYFGTSKLRSNEKKKEFKLLISVFSLTVLLFVARGIVCFTVVCDIIVL